MHLFGKPTKTIESRVARLYQAFASTARRYRYPFRRPELTVGGKPTIALFGNHSSGKSTIINDLLGDPPVQETGVAPTDDCFTVLVHGAKDRDFRGPAALGQLPSEFKVFASLGPEFLARLVVKVRNRAFLSGANLVDSPGMIDAPRGSSAREYDFAAAARAFAELADLVLFIFDPEKPGTTGESVDVLSACARGLEFKLRVLLNKSDSFDSIEDYARAYGTLCWNLARAMPTKDIPRIYTTWTPSTENRLAAKIPIDIFERHRATLLEELRGASQRRVDSVIAAAQADISRLSIQARVLASVKRGLFFRRAVFATSSFFAVLLAGAFSYFFLRGTTGGMSSEFLRGCLVYGGTAVIAAAVAAAGALWSRFDAKRRRVRVVKNLDDVFYDVYSARLATGATGHLKQHWDDVKGDVASLVSARAAVPLFSWGDFSRLDRALDHDLPAIAAAGRGPAES